MGDKYGIGIEMSVKPSTGKQENLFNTGDGASKAIDKKICKSVNVSYIDICNRRLTTCTLFDNSLLIGGFEGILYIMDLDTDNITSYEISRYIIRSFEIDKSMNLLYIGTDNGELIVFDLLRRRIVFTETISCPIYSIQKFGNKRVLTGSKNGEILEWSIVKINNKVERLHTTKIIKKFDSVVFAMKAIETENVVLITNSNGELIEYNYDNKEERFSKLSNSSVFSVETSELGILSGMSNGDVIIKRSIGANKVLFGHSDTVRSMCLSQTKKWLFTASKDRTIRAWNLFTGETDIISITDDYAYDIELSDDDKTLFVTDGIGNLSRISFDKFVDYYDVIDIE